MRKRLGRAEQAGETRRRLLDAARRTFVRRGFHGATLADVAREAGFTKGAVYSRFRGKGDLFLAVLERHVEERIAEIRDATAAAGSPAASRTLLARQWAERMRRDPAWALLIVEFRVHAARVPALNRRYRAIHARLLAALADAFAHAAREARAAFVVSAEQAARTLVALGTGALLERAADADAFPDALLETAMEALHDGLADPAASASLRRSAS